MMNKKMRNIARMLLAFACVLTLGIPNTIVYAAPPTDALEDKTSDLKDELSDLNSEVAALSSDMNDIMSKLETTTAEMEQTKQELADAQVEEDAQYEAMKARIKYMYENGDSTMLEILFTSRSMAEFLNNAEYISTISEYDRDMLERLHTLQDDIEKKESTLKKEQENLVSLKTDLSAKESALTAKISSTSGELAQYSDQLAKAQALAAAAQEALDKKAEAQKKQEASNSGNQGNSGGGSSNSGGGSSGGGNSGGGSNNSGGGGSSESADDATLFAAILQCEAGSYDGMLAVATVIMNRKESRSYPNTLRGVIYQSGQFAPTWNGALDRVLNRGPSSTARNVANAALGGARHDAVRNCYQFRTATPSNSYRGVVIGGNVFF